MADKRTRGWPARCLIVSARRATSPLAPHPETSAHPIALLARVCESAARPASRPPGGLFLPSEPASEPAVSWTGPQGPAPRDSKDPPAPREAPGTRASASLLPSFFPVSRLVPAGRPPATMFVPCGESAPDLAGFTLLMVSLRLRSGLLPREAPAVSPPDAGCSAVPGERGPWFLFQVLGRKKQGGCSRRQTSQWNLCRLSNQT